MTAPSPSFLHSSPVESSRFQRGVKMRKDLAGNSGAYMTEADVLADIVARALWLSFPEECSEDGISIAAAPYFRNKRGEPISPRTVKYWLRGETLPSALHLSTLVMMQPKLFISQWFRVLK